MRSVGHPRQGLTVKSRSVRSTDGGAPSARAAIIGALLFRRTPHGAVRAEHATVTRQRTQDELASCASVEPLARVGRHRLFLPMTATGARNRRPQGGLGTGGGLALDHRCSKWPRPMLAATATDSANGSFMSIDRRRNANSHFERKYLIRAMTSKINTATIKIQTAVMPLIIHPGPSAPFIMSLIATDSSTGRTADHAVRRGAWCVADVRHLLGHHWCATDGPRLHDASSDLANKSWRRFPRHASPSGDRRSIPTSPFPSVRPQQNTCHLGLGRSSHPPRRTTRSCLIDLQPPPRE